MCARQYGATLTEFHKGMYVSTWYYLVQTGANVILTVYENLAALIGESTRASAAELEQDSENIIGILTREIEV